MLNKMYISASSSNSDMIICRIVSVYNNVNKIDSYPIIYDKILIIKQIILYGQFSTSVCDKLVRQSIYTKVIFPEYHYTDDRVITIQSIYYSNNINYLDEALYYYNKNDESVCGISNQEKKIKDEYNNLIAIELFLKNNNIFSDVEIEFTYRSNILKASFLKNRKLRKYSKEVFFKLYPNSVNNIKYNKYKLGAFDKFILNNKNKIFIFFIIDVYIIFENIIKWFYKLIIPKKIRYSLWEKRNNIC